MKANVSDTWARINKYAVRNKRRRTSRKSSRRKREANATAHALDRQRQQRETGTNWTLVRHLLDNEGLSLDRAKQKARRIKAWTIE